MIKNFTTLSGYLCMFFFDNYHFSFCLVIAGLVVICDVDIVL